jgi:DNA-binding XRE family transcriptional regulator
MPLHEFVQQRRKQVHPGWSQGDLARHAGVHPTTIGRLEKGQLKTPELLLKVAPYIDVSFVELWRRAGHLSAEDAAAFTEWLAEVSPAELVSLGLERGGWPPHLIAIVKKTLDLAEPQPPP